MACEPSIRIEKDEFFPVDFDFLKKGHIQYYHQHFEPDDLKNANAFINSLDKDVLNLKKGSHIIIYKQAYILPVNKDVIFNKKFHTNSNFLLANNANLDKVQIDPHNPMIQTHTLAPVIGLKKATVYTVKHEEIFLNHDSKHSSQFLKVITDLWAENIDAPRIMTTKTIKSKGLLLGGTDTSFYYAISKDQTLVITYKIAVLKPSYKLKIAFGFGLIQHFLAKEEENLRLSVIKSRSYLKQNY